MQLPVGSDPSASASEKHNLIVLNEKTYITPVICQKLIK